jgi:predicted RNA-binding Zn-ribbon protein involved in translation (DUF1610 family)
LLSLIDGSEIWIGEVISVKKEYRILESRFPLHPEFEKAQFPAVDFTSITKSLSRLSGEHRIVCPKCGAAINFNSAIEWYGPSHFTCTSCKELVHVRRIQVKTSD